MNGILKTWTYEDRSMWESGPWDNEPDKAHWVDAVTGYDCLMVRNFSGAWCGYVGVPIGHPLYEASMDSLPDLMVHGGVSFCEGNESTDEEELLRGFVNHPTSNAANNVVWWFGFDCSHSFDLTPLLLIPSTEGREYRDVRFVTKQIQLLAEQLANVTPRMLPLYQELKELNEGE